MPIASLTRSASFPEIGQIRKGGEKPADGKKPGADLDYFRFTSDSPEAVDLWLKEVGERPRAVNVFLPFSSLEENFEYWQEAYTTGAIQHRCDGVTCSGWRTESGKWVTDPVPCPGGCKPVGRLKVFIPVFQRMAFVTVLTTSKHDIVSLQSSLFALELLKHSLQGVPLVLRRVEREITTPADNGNRARRKKWLLQIEAEPQWAALQFGAMREAALLSASREPLLLESGDDDEGDEGDNAVAHAEAVPARSNNGTAAYASPELVSKVRALWPKFGTRKNGLLIPFERILSEHKWTQSTWPLERAQKTLADLEAKAVSAANAGQPMSTEVLDVLQGEVV